MISRIKSKERKVFIAVDLYKAYDNVNRKEKFKILESRAQKEKEKFILELNTNLY